MDREYNILLQKASEINMLNCFVVAAKHINAKTSILEVETLDKKFVYYLKEFVVYLNRDEKQIIIDKYKENREKSIKELFSSFKRVDISQPYLL